jgi:hypothetical protein
MGVQLMNLTPLEFFCKVILYPLAFLFPLVVEGLSALIEKAKLEGLYSGIAVGANREIASHLQFADDTLLLCENLDSNIWEVKSVFLLFELAPGLKVHFHKSQVITFNVDEIRQQDIASFLGCRIGTIPFIYLGLLIGGNHKRLSVWQSVVEKARRRLSGWASKNLFLEGRIVCVKIVLTALSIFYLSFFQSSYKYPF